MLAKLGSINFLNSLPINYAFEKGIIQVPAKIIKAVPTVLNQKILKKELDISSISSIEYLLHKENFLLLSNLSISSDTGINSVILLSRQPIEKIKIIKVTQQGITTPILLKILLTYYYQIKVEITERTSTLGKLLKNEEAILLIGDQALYAINRKDGFYKLDLSKIWRTFTGKKMVFALWVVRKEFAVKYPTKTTEIHQALLNSKKWGLSHLKIIVDYAHQKYLFPKKFLKEYFKNLKYDFNKNYEEGLNLYYHYAKKFI